MNVRSSFNQNIHLCLCLAMGLMLGACGSEGNPEPVIDAVVPSTVTSLASTPAVIEGANFYSRAHLNIDNNRATTEGKSYQVVVGSRQPQEALAIAVDRIDFEVPAGLAPGIYSVTVIAPAGDTYTLADALTVLDDQGLAMSIEDAADGSGASVNGRTILLGSSLTLHAIGRRDSNFLMPVDAGWSVQSSAASLSSAAGTQTELQALSVGDAIVTIDHPNYASVSATVSVAECLGDGDCVDPCRSTNACVAGACVQGPLDLDVDGDGAVDDSCAGGTDCDDTIATGTSCASGCAIFFFDGDSDSLGDSGSPSAESTCTAPTGYVANSSDCDDALASCTTDCTNADGDALALCAGDCDDSGATGATCTAGCAVFFADTDSDTFGDAANPSSALCSAPAGFVANDTDCDDAITACTSDCTDADGDAVALCAGDCDDSAATGGGCATGCTTFFADADSDFFGDPAVSSALACAPPTGFVADNSDCDDNPLACGDSCFPGNAVADICDGDNQDCDGAVDEDPELVWFEDEDVDGFGCTVSLNACTQPAGFVANDTDCDDDPLSCGNGCFPANPAADICDGDNQDCDASVDEDPEIVWFADDDGDGFGDSLVTLNACTQPTSFVNNSSDCDDNPLACGNSCFPGNTAADICDGDNQDCDGAVDEDPEFVWFQDADGDSFGNPAVTANACTQPVGFVADDLDCADDLTSDPVCGGLSGNFCNPGVSEGPNGDATCSDGADNDCDTDVDVDDADCDAGITVTLRFNNAGVAENLINFPVLVTLTPANFDYSTADSLGADLLFEDEDGATVLPHEIDVWNPGGTSQIWVLVPQIDANSNLDHIFLSYGDLASAPLEDPDTLWGAYHAVWHLEESGDENGNDYIDSSPQNNHGQGGGGSGSRVPAADTGQIGNGQRFDGGNDRIAVSPSAGFNFSTNAVTMEYWAQADTLSNAAMVALGKGGSPGYRSGIEQNGVVAWMVEGTLARTPDNAVGTTLAHIVVTWDGSTMRNYVNGVQAATRSKGGNLGASSADFLIGIGPTGFPFDGVIDEARVLNDVLSAPWIAAQFRTTSNSYITFE